MNAINALKKMQTKVQREIKNRAGYLARSLHNAPKRATRQPAEKQRPGASYEQAEVPNRIFFPDPDGGEPIDSGMTVEEYLKSINGGYRATGSGSFMQRERHTNWYKRNADGSIYHNKAGKRVWEVKPTFTGSMVKKGTAKISAAEQKKLDRLRDREREMLKKQTEKGRKALQSIQKQIREAEKQANDKRRLTPKQLAKATQKATTLRAKYASKQAELKRTKEQKKREFREKHVRYRITAPKGFEPHPKPFTMLRKGGKPGEIKTWGGAGGLDHYIAKHWDLKEVTPMNFQLKLKPASHDQYLTRTEEGGTFQAKPVVYGYLVYFRDSSRLSHRRVSFLPLYTKPKQARVSARHWVQKTIDKVHKKYIEGAK